MRDKTSRLQKRRRAVIRVPGWYYTLLVAIALVGSLLIVYGMRNPTINAAAVTEEGDYPMGEDNAPVTIWEWANFQ